MQDKKLASAMPAAKIGDDSIKATVGCLRFKFCSLSMPCEPSEPKYQT